MIGRSKVKSRMVLLGLEMLAGCTAPRGPIVVTDPDPSIKILAISAAVQNKDLRVAKQLVADLDADDPAVRFYAIQGLERLTDLTFGYKHYDDETERKPAVLRWQQWLAAQER